MFWHRSIQYITVVTWAYLIISNVILSLWCLSFISIINILYAGYRNTDCCDFGIIHGQKLKGLISCEVIDPFFNYEGCCVCEESCKRKLFRPRNVYLTKVNDIFTTTTLKSICWQYISQRIALVVWKWLFYLSMTT